MHTEDHPLAYLDFEGNIPKGEYGGGSMIVWDRGRWIPEGDPHKGLAKGHLAFTLEGDRLKGRWHLVRMRPRAGEKTESWLLIKSEDEFARPAGAPEITDEEVTSQKSGLTNAELAATTAVREDHEARLAAGKRRQAAVPDIGKIAGARKGLLPVFLEPSLASPCDRPPTGAKWVHEIKHDGYRIEGRIDGRSIKLLTRKALDWTERFASIAEALRALGLGSALIDGEIVVEDAGGILSFNNLQADLKAGRQDRGSVISRSICFVLRGLRPNQGGAWQSQGGAAGRARGTARGLADTVLRTSFDRRAYHAGAFLPVRSQEGIVSKRVDLPYRPGRGDHYGSRPSAGKARNW